MCRKCCVIISKSTVRVYQGSFMSQREDTIQGIRQWTPDSRAQTNIFRLRTGHCGLRKHLNRLGLADSAHHECGSEEQTPEHILQTCTHLETVREQFWPEDTEVGTKLWGASCRTTADSGLPSSHRPED